VDVAGRGKRSRAQRQALRARVEASSLLDAAQFAAQLAAVLVDNLDPPQTSSALTAPTGQTATQTGSPP
jgi:hypothetical protein